MKSSFSNGVCACVEILHHGSTVSIRDSKYRRNPAADPAAQPIITVELDEFSAWIAAVGTGDLPIVAGALMTSATDDGGAIVCHRPTGVCLTYTPAEWSAWRSGVEADSFVAV
ncbi:MAG: DUF397 domain-containing protein [Actinomycetota bacterium]